MPDDQDDILSPEEVEANQIFLRYDTKIRDVQTKLDAMKETQPKPFPKPGWIGREFSATSETNTSLQTKIAGLEKQAKGRVAEIAEKSRPSIQGKLYEKADTWRTKPPSQKDEKSLDESTSFVGRMRERGKFAEQQKEFTTTNGRNGMPFTENKQDATVKPSNYYSHLHFNDKENPKLPDIDKNIDAPELGRED